MSLTNRLSGFFLASLAVILLGFSGGIYVLAKNYLYGQLDARLTTALDTLEAAVDIETDGLEWEPQDRRLLIGSDPGPDQIRWTVSNDRDQIIDRSDNLANVDFPANWQPSSWPDSPTDGTTFSESGGWRLAGRRLQLEPLLRLGRGRAEESEPDEEVEYPTLYLRAGVSPGPIQANLKQLALAVTLLPLALWLGCAIVGRRICRRALKPLTQMATSARAMTAVDSDERLPLPQTHDELAELGEAFNGLLDRLHEAIERQQRFTGDASHQLRTPITGLLTLLEVVRRRQRPAGEYEETLDRVHEEVTRMRQIVESLLFLARGQTDAMVLECEPIDLADWLPRQVERWKANPRAEGIHFEAGSVDPARISAQPMLLAQLLDNLIDNACKYSGPASPIAVRLERGAGMVGFSVQDRGCGIAAEDLPHVFEPFYRSAESRRQGKTGVGLGLALAQRVAASFGGTLTVHSELGQGSLFSAKFPELSRSAGAVESAAKPARPLAPAQR